MSQLTHYGILGQKWGVRRFQNEDGSLTKAGQKKYTTDSGGNLKKIPMAKGKKVAIGVLAAGGTLTVAGLIAKKKLKDPSALTGSPNILQTIFAVPFLAKALIEK